MERKTKSCRESFIFSSTCPQRCFDYRLYILRGVGSFKTSYLRRSVILKMVGVSQVEIAANVARTVVVVVVVVIVVDFVNSVSEYIFVVSVFIGMSGSLFSVMNLIWT